MSRYAPKRILTKSTTLRKSKLTRVLVSAGVTLLLVSLLSPIGHEQDSVPTVCPTSSLTVVMLEPIKPDWPRPVEASFDYSSTVLNEPEVEDVPEPTVEVVAKCSYAEIILAAQALWGEARDCSKEEQMLVIWCMCNRADAWEQSIEEVVTAPHQFVGYSPDNPVDDELVAVVEEVMSAWSMEQEALVHEPFATSSEYLFFYGDGQHNWFREEY